VNSTRALVPGTSTPVSRLLGSPTVVSVALYQATAEVDVIRVNDGPTIEPLHSQLTTGDVARPAHRGGSIVCNGPAPQPATCGGAGTTLRALNQPGWTPTDPS